MFFLVQGESHIWDYEMGVFSVSQMGLVSASFDQCEESE